MASRRSAKRARKKERRAQRREQWLRYRRQRRRRWLVLFGSVAAILALAAVVALAVLRPHRHRVASPSPRTRSSIHCRFRPRAAPPSPKPSFKAPDDQHLDASKRYIWRLETSCGRIDVALDVKRAPKTANSIVFLTRKGFYDGLVFHRNVPGFVIQGGDPTGTGQGGPGYQVVEAPPPNLTYAPGVVAMAKTQADPPGASGSQFFIMVGTKSPLPPEYALAGTVTAGMDVARAIVTQDQGEPPPSYVYIERATIIEE